MAVFDSTIHPSLRALCQKQGLDLACLDCPVLCEGECEIAKQKVSASACVQSQ